MNTFKKFFAIATIAVSISPAAAQTVGEFKDSTFHPLYNMEEVVVYSVKDKETTKNIPASVTGITAAEIERREVTSIKDLTSRIPNFFMPDYGSKLTSPVYVRGIGSRTGAPSVGMYVDNAPFFEKSAFDFELNDIERIEVLRGPQGTLYGRNTMGGIINIYTKSPLSSRSTRISVTGANYNSYRTSFSHNQPIGDNLGIKVAGTYGSNGGFYKNAFTNDPVDQADVWSGRIKLAHKMSDKLKSEYSITFDNSQQGGYPYAIYNSNTQQASDISYDKYSSYNRKLLTANALFQFNGNKLNITSITNYQFLDDIQEIDQDFTPQSLFFVEQDQLQHAISHEVVAKSGKNNKHYEWLVGAFGFVQQFDKTVDVTYGEDGIAKYKLPGPTSKIKGYDQIVSGAAFFHQSTINILENLSLAMGIRFDYEKSNLDYYYDSNTSGNVTRVDAFDNSLENFEIVPKVTLKYGFGKNRSAYASVSKGYNSGGFNSTIEEDKHRTYDAETSYNYEVGVKTDWFSNRFTTNVSLFYIDWKNQQIYQTVPSGQGSMIVNAGLSESSGVEAEIFGRLTRDLSMHASYGYTRAMFNEYVVSATVNYNDKYIPYIPEHTFDVGASYTFNLNKSFAKTLVFDVTYQGVGKHYWNDANTAYQDFYGLLNAKVSVATRYFELGIWGKNILAEDYNSFYFSALGNSYVQIGKPARFGITLGVKI